MGQGDLVGVGAEYGRRHRRETTVALAVLDVRAWNDPPLLKLAASDRVGSLKGDDRNRAVRSGIEVTRRLDGGQLRPQGVDFRVRCRFDCHAPIVSP